MTTIIVLVILLTLLAYLRVQNPFVPVAFLTGGIFSGLCGFLGMKTATFASARTAHGASQSLNKGLKVAFRSGAVMGLVVVGFGLLDISIWYFILDKFIYTETHMAEGLRIPNRWIKIRFRSALNWGLEPTGGAKELATRFPL